VDTEMVARGRIGQTERSMKRWFGVKDSTTEKSKGLILAWGYFCLNSFVARGTATCRLGPKGETDQRKES